MPAEELTKPEPVRTAVRFPLHLELVFAAEEVPPLGSSVEFRLSMPAKVMGGAEDVTLHCTGRIVRHASSDGKRLAAAVIDEYVLKAEQV